MTELYPGLRRAVEICTDLARECHAKLSASPQSPASIRRHAEARALRRIRARLTDEMLAEPITARCRRVGCPNPTTHPSGMCEDHQPGFAQADEAEAA